MSFKKCKVDTINRERLRLYGELTVSKTF